MKLKVDNRIRVILENASGTGHRSLVVLVGEKSKDQVVFIHNLLTNACMEPASVLWCYKKELSLSSNRKKRFRQIQASIQTGQAEANMDNLFEKFVTNTSIKYCYYKDSFRVLGNTYKMCVLQDFEGVTANTLCRVVETVEGGGAIVLLLQSIESLKQLYTLSMDVHARYRTHAHQKIVPRFNERLLQSLSSCSTCIVIDDHLRVVPHSTHVAEVTANDHKLANAPLSANETKLRTLKTSMKETPPLGKLVEVCKTLDQAKVLLQFSLAITEKMLRTTVSLTAARGRGKSAAMGLAIAGALAFGYSNIFVTSPSPENLKTLFEFLEKGLQAAGYDDAEYTIDRAGEELQKSVTRVTVSRGQRQVVQYITPDQHGVLGQAELVVIDEAAAIPLPMVRALMGPYLVFLSSTISGYEGTGRSLALKLIAELRQESNSGTSQRKLMELSLSESIRYQPNDPVEHWLMTLLCLEPNLPKLPKVLPKAEECQLLHVNRDTLFSYHKLSEQFLSSIQSLLVCSHYRNSPDDLQQLSDAPGHHLFVLVSPHTDTDSLPTVLVVLQVVLEGGISKAVTVKGLNCTDYERPAGDLIPWTISNAFQNYDFPQFAGVRILRIATHPEAQGRKYGSRAVELLRQYYMTNTHLASDTEIAKTIVENRETMKIVRNGELQTIGSSASTTPPLLSPLSSRPAEAVHYLGVAFGVTQQLLTFWKRSNFSMVYISQVSNKLTGEHTVIMLNRLQNSDVTSTLHSDWLASLYRECMRRMVYLASSYLRHFSCQLTLSALCSSVFKPTNKGNSRSVRNSVTEGDLKRLRLFQFHQCEAPLISDIISKVARLYFLDHIRGCKLKGLEAAVLCGLGLLKKTEADLAKEFNLEMRNILETKHKMLQKLNDALNLMLSDLLDSEEDEEAVLAKVESVAKVAKNEIGEQKKEYESNLQEMREVDKRVQEERKKRKMEQYKEDKSKRLDIHTIKKKKRML